MKVNITANLDLLKNVKDYQEASQRTLNQESFEYLESAVEDKLTSKRNRSIFQQVQIRPRRLINVSEIDMSVRMFGQSYRTPIILSPIGLQKQFYPEGELATARAADAAGHLMIVATTSHASIEDINKQIKGNHRPWFQLYPSNDLEFRQKLVKRVEAAGCSALLLSVDTPVLGNREMHGDRLKNKIDRQNFLLGNLKTMPQEVSYLDPSLAWRSIPWLKVNTSMKIFLKGIMTGEDARLAVEHGVDGVIVSNQGGRQLESNLSTLEVLEEVLEAVKGRIPVILEGGIRRGTDIFKALALGAKAICIGRPYIYGLSVGGEEGVKQVLGILESELKRNMQLAGVTSLKDLNKDFVRWI
ncbi:MAG: alpha-hydroxy acid oxidase [Bacteroidota bacterium]